MLLFGSVARVRVLDSAFMANTTSEINLSIQGDTLAAKESFPRVYEELRKLARAKVAKLPAHHSIHATVLVHEAWLRLSKSPSAAKEWKNRRHFYGAAAESMRHILVEHVRRRQAQKRGGGMENDPFEESRIIVQADNDELLVVHEGLELLAREDETAAEVVKLRYFIGMSIQETAETLSLAPRTVNRYWTFARTWLKAYMARR
jgi:RNA polymerase sigma factor (TIGR02999 family)